MGVKEDILALEATWSVAPLEADLQTVKRVTADDWIGVAPTGEIMTKADLIERLSGPIPFDSVVYEDVKIHVYEHTAVVTSFTRAEGKDIKLEQDPTRMRPSDVQILLGDCSKIMEKTGWKPEIPFDKTLTDLRDFWRDRL